MPPKRTRAQGTGETSRTETGLAMETSKVKSGVRNQAEAKLNQLEHSEAAGTIRTSCKR
ncbi:hypothetical protein F511_19413 [Dorcoceras hygrometricum]|uniref:Uncharacterized protein n=1 Tax=Dorcoceras hygrometricum TaxID=472368 RepID=A0A2Z7CV29_9LAMI|nr:hypothetical protein F511_19413 [Dorcoceras hygrometricum]